MASKVISTILTLQDKMSGKIITVSEKVKDMSKEAQRASKQVANMANEFKSKAVEMSNTALKFASMGATIASGLALKTGLGESMNLEGYRVQIETATKDTKKAGEIMKWANKFANITPFETGEVVEGSAKLEAMGLSAQKYLPMIADMAGATNKSLDQANEAFIDAQAGELERLKEFGIKKIDIAKKANEMFKNQEIINNKGQIVDQEKFNQALMALMEQKFKGGAEKLAGTTKGLWSTIKGTVVSSLAEMTGMTAEGVIKQDSLLDRIKTKALEVANQLQKWQDDGSITALSNKISNGFSIMYNVISKFVNFVIDHNELIINFSIAIGSLMIAIKVANGLKIAFIGLQIAWAILNGTITLTPLGWITLAIAGVITVSIMLIRKWDTVIECLSKLKSKFIEFKNVAIDSTINKFNEFKEKMIEIYDGFITLKDKAIEWVITKFNDFTNVLVDNKGAIETTASILGVVFAPALIKTGIEAGIAGAKIIASFITSIITTGTEATISGTKLTVSFIASLITTGTEAVVNGAKLTASFIASLISAGTQAVISGAQITASFIVSLVQSASQAAITAATITGQLITSLVNYVVQGWQAAITIGAQTTAWVIQGAQIVIVTAAQVAQNIAVGAWNIICGIATGVTTAFGAALAFLTSPVGLVILAIGGLIAIGVLLYENWGTVKDVAYSVFGSIESFIGGICDSVGGFFKGMINGVINGLNSMIGALNNLNVDIPDWVPLLGGKKLGFSIPKIPAFALGTNHAGGGPSLVGEHGPEIINLKKGDTVTTANETRKILGSGDGYTFIINFNGITIGEEEWFEKAGEHIANKIKIELQR